MLAPGVGYLTYDQLYWTTDNGSHWANVTLPAPVKQEQVLSLFFLNTSTGWVLLGEAGDPEPTLDIASTNDAGASWSVMHVDLPVNPNEPIMPQGDIYFTDADHGWMNLTVEGGSAFHVGELFRTVDGGKKWIRVGHQEQRARCISSTSGMDGFSMEWASCWQLTMAGTTGKKCP